MYRYIPMMAYQAGFVAKVLKGDTITSDESFELTRGFQSRNWKWSGNWKQPELFRIEMDLVSPYVDSFINYASRNKVRLYLMYPPQSAVSYAGSVKPAQFHQKVNEYRRKYGHDIHYLDMNTPVLYNDSTLFYNHLHLNSTGVQLFMKDLLENDSTFLSFR